MFDKNFYRNCNPTLEVRFKELEKKCMNFAKEQNLQFFKNWHVGLCVDIQNYDKRCRCKVRVCGVKGTSFFATYESYYEFANETGYKASSHFLSDPQLVLYSYNNYNTDDNEESNLIQDLYFIEITGIIRDIPYYAYSNIQNFEPQYLNILNNKPWTIFSLKHDYRDEISFILYMPAFESEIKLMQKIYPGLNDRGEIYFSELESKLILFYLEIKKLSTRNSDKEYSLENNTFLESRGQNDSDLNISHLQCYDNVIPELPSTTLFNPINFTEILDGKRLEIENFVKSLDISDISNNYILHLEQWYSRVGGNRDGYDVAHLSIEVSKDDRRDNYISKFLPSHISTDDFLNNNAEYYYDWSKKDELDNYVFLIQQNIKNKFLEKYSLECHVSYLLYQFVYDAYNSEQRILNETLENSLKILRLKNWISRFFLS